LGREFLTFCVCVCVIFCFNAVIILYYYYYIITIIIIQIRNVWYQIMKALKDEDTQRKGFIKVVYALGGTLSRMKQTQSMDTELFFKGITLIFEVLPFRLAALHYCFEDPKIRPVIATVQYVIGKAGRLRFRAHYGKKNETYIYIGKKSKR
jgi:hypothetical protein